MFFKLKFASLALGRGSLLSFYLLSDFPRDACLVLVVSVSFFDWEDVAWHKVIRFLFQLNTLHPVQMIENLILILLNLQDRRGCQLKPRLFFLMKVELG